MDGMKPSGVDWIGDIPEEWEVSKINYLYELRKEKVSDTDYPPLSVTMHGILPQLDTAAKTDAHDDRKRVCAGDFVINSRSDRRGSCGISPYDGSVSLINTVLEPRESMSPEFYNWLFHTSMFADEFYKQGNGIVDDLWSTNWTAMKDIRIVVPSFGEQNRIAQTLANVVGSIDSASRTLDGQLDVLQRYRASIIHETVTRGLDPNVEMKPSGVDWIGDIPVTWEAKPFKYVAKVSAKLVDPNDYPDLIEIDPENIEKDSGDLVDVVTVGEVGAISNKQLFHKDQILYSKIRPALNKVAIASADGLCSADMYPIDTWEKNEWLLYVMRSDVFVSQTSLVASNRVKMPKINVDELARIMIPVPSFEEQQEIADYLDSRCSVIDSIIDTKQKQLDILKRRRSSLIFEYVTGKRRVD